MPKNAIIFPAYCIFIKIFIYNSGHSQIPMSYSKTWNSFVGNVLPISHTGRTLHPQALSLQTTNEAMVKERDVERGVS